MPLTVAEAQTRLSADTGDHDRALRASRQEVGRYGDETTKAGGQARGFQSSLGGLTGGLAAMINPATLAVGAIAGLGAGLASTVGIAAEFESGMSQIKAATGATGTELKSLETLALDLGMAMDVGSVSAKDAQGAIFELAKAGVTVEDQLSGATKASLQLAAAAGPDFGVANAAALAANAMNTFGLAGKDAAHVADVFVGAANASTASLGDLKYGMAAVGSVAATVGLSFEDTATALAVMSAKGLQGSDAGTSLKTALLNLQPVSDKQIALFKDLGLMTANGANQFFTAEGKVKSLAEVSGLLEDKLGHLTKAEQLMALETIGGSDAVRSLSILMAEGKDGVLAMEAAMLKQGDASAAAATMSDNLKGKWEALNGTVDTLKIQIGSALLPALTGIVEKGAELLGSPGVQAFVQNLTTAIPALLGLLGTLVGRHLTELGAALQNVQTVAQPFLTVLNSLGQYFAAVVTDGDALNDWLMHLPEPIRPAVQMLGELVTIAQAVNTAFQTGGLVSALDALAAAFPALQGPVDTFKAALTSIQETVNAVAFAFQNGGLSLALDTLATRFTFLQGPVDLIKGAMGALAGPMDAVQGVLDRLGGVADAVGGRFTTFATNVGNGLSIFTGLSALVSQLAGDFTYLVTGSGDAAAAVQGLVSGALAQLGTTLQPLAAVVQGLATAFGQGGFGGAVAYLSAQFPALAQPLASVQTLFTQLGQTAQMLGFAFGANGLAGVWNLLTGSVTTGIPLLDGMRGALQNLQPVADAINMVFNVVGTKLQEIGGQVLPAATAAWRNMQPGIAQLQPILQAVQQLFSQVAGILGGVLSTALQGAAAILGGIVVTAISTVMGVLQGLVGMLPGVGTTFSGLATTVRGVVEGLVTLISGLVETVSALLRGDWQGAWDAAVATVEGLAGNIDTILQGLWTTIGGIFEAGIGAVTGFVSGFGDTLGNLIEGFVPGILGNTRNIGTALVDGIKQGIQNAWGAFTGWIQAQFDKLPEPIRKALESFSPSRKMIPIGESIPDGIRVGIDQAMPALGVSALRAGELAALGLKIGIEQKTPEIKQALDYARDFTHAELLAMSPALAAAAQETGKQTVAGLTFGIDGEIPSTGVSWGHLRDYTATQIQSFKDLTIADLQVTGQEAVASFATKVAEEAPATAPAFASLRDFTATEIQSFKGLTLDDLRVTGQEAVASFKTALEAETPSTAAAFASLTTFTTDEITTFNQAARAKISEAGADIPRVFSIELQNATISERALDYFKGYSLDELAMISPILAEEARRTGVATGQGYADGLRSTQAEIASATQETMGGVVYNANATLEVESPSKVFQRIGQMTGKGYEIGLRASMQDALTVGQAILGQGIGDLTLPAPTLTGGPRGHEPASGTTIPAGTVPALPPAVAPAQGNQGGGGPVYQECVFINDVKVTDPNIRKLLFEMAQFLSAQNGGAAVPGVTT